MQLAESTDVAGDARAKSNHCATLLEAKAGFLLNDADYGAAEQLWREVIQLRNELLKRESLKQAAESRYRFSLASAHAGLVEVYMATGRTEEAVVAREQTLAVMNALTAETPEYSDQVEHLRARMAELTEHADNNSAASDGDAETDDARNVPPDETPPNPSP